MKPIERASVEQSPTSPGAQRLKLPRQRRPEGVKQLAEGRNRTGVQYRFAVTMCRADGTDRHVWEARVVAISKATAWTEVGRQIGEFMNSEDGRVVEKVEMLG